MDILKWIENWYLENCDGDWEHTYGVKIVTSDNPGWIVEIDFSETTLKVENIPYKLFEVSDTNWYGYSINNSVFKGVGDPQKLEFLLSLFKEIAENNG